MEYAKIVEPVVLIAHLQLNARHVSQDPIPMMELANFVEAIAMCVLVQQNALHVQMDMMFIMALVLQDVHKDTMPQVENACHVL